VSDAQAGVPGQRLAPGLPGLQRLDRAGLLFDRRGGDAVDQGALQVDRGAIAVEPPVAARAAHAVAGSAQQA